MKIFSKVHLFIFSLLLLLCPIGFKTDLFSSSSSRDCSSCLSSSRPDHHNRRGKCQQFTWRSLKGADNIVVYADGKPSFRDIVLRLATKDLPFLENLLLARKDAVNYLVVAFDKNGKKQEIIKVNVEEGFKICQPPCVITRHLTPGEVGAEYLDTIRVSPRSPAATYRIIKGNLPTGLLLSRNGTVAGIPTETGIFDFIVRAKSKCGSSRPYGIRIVIDCPEVVFVTTTLPDGDVGIVYSETIEVTGDPAPTLFNIVSGALPTGLTLSSTGNLSGTPTVAGTYDFSVRAVNACGSSATLTYSVVIAQSCTAPTITTTELPLAFRDVPYTETVEATGGVSPITFSLSAGSLPTGMTLSVDGTLSGTCSQGGSPTFNFTVRATSSCGSFVDQPLSITVVDG